jgi:hypothetical protein
MRQDLTSFYVWEILHSTISRMSKQVDKVKNEYTQLNEKFRKSTLDADVRIFLYIFCHLEPYCIKNLFSAKKIKIYNFLLKFF